MKVTLADSYNTAIIPVERNKYRTGALDHVHEAHETLERIIHNAE